MGPRNVNSLCFLLMDVDGDDGDGAFLHIFLKKLSSGSSGSLIYPWLNDMT